MIEDAKLGEKEDGRFKRKKKLCYEMEFAL